MELWKDLLEIDRRRRDVIERQVSNKVAHLILQKLPADQTQAGALIQQGGELAGRMSWNNICRKYFLPALDHAYHNYRARQTA